MQRIDFTGRDGVNIAADCGGDAGAPVVLLLHGGGQTRHSWRRTATALVGRGFRVVSIDLRGHGESDWSPTKAYDLDDFAGDLRSVMAQLSNPPAVVGASLGGLAALTVLGEERNPGVARALVLVDVVPRLSTEGTGRISEFLNAHLQGFASIEEAAEAVAAYTNNRRRPRDISGLRRNLRAGPDGRLYWHWDPGFVAGQRDTPPHLARERLETAARNVRVPTLLVRGAQSDLVTPDAARELVTLIPDCEYFDVEGAGHMVVGDRNDAFDRSIVSFLERTR
jgi:non-heme chloroperoxidase